MSITFTNHFLRTYLKGMSTGVVTIWNEKESAPHFFKLGQPDVLGKMAQLAETMMRQKKNVYYSVLPLRDKPASGRGKAEDIGWLPGFFCDIDVIGDTHKAKKAYAQTVEEAQKILESFLPPSVLVHTGGGLHGYWLLDTPVKIESPDDFALAKAMTQQFQSALQQLFRQNGREIDNVGDLARLGRLPGSINFKRPETPLPVTILSPNPLDENAVQRYSCDAINEATRDLAALFYARSALSHQTIKQEGSVAFMPAPNLDVLTRRCAFFQYCQAQGDALPEPHWHAWINNAALAARGEAYIHQWSQQDSRYDPSETQTRIDRALQEPRPHTCSVISGELGFAGCPVFLCPVQSPIAWAQPKMACFDRLLAILEEDDKKRRDERIASSEAVDDFLIAATINPTWTDRFKAELSLKGIDAKKLKVMEQVAQQRSAALNREELNGSLLHWQEKFCNQAGFSFKMPQGYLVNSAGEIISTDGKDVVSHQFLGISKRYLMAGNKIRDALLFQAHGGKWSEKIVEPVLLASQHKILELANVGIGVTSLNATDLVRYIAKFKTWNGDQIPTLPATENLGWQADGSFLPYASDYHLFDPNADDHDQMDVWEPKGTLDSWRSHIEPLRAYPGFRITLAAAFASPLLKQLSVRTFLLHVWAPSRGGKTTAQLAAATIWRNPRDLQISFNATPVAMEFKSSLLAHLPMLVDERQLAGQDQDWLNNLVYMLGGGQSKARGTTSGRVRPMRRWQNIILTTGEVPLSADGGAEGILTRMLETYFQEILPTSLASDLHKWGYADYGSAGKAFITQVIQQADVVAQVFAEMQTAVSGLIPKDARHVGAYRDYLAVLATADTLSSVWVFDNDLEQAKAEAISLVTVWLDSMKHAQRPPESERIVQFVQDWLVCNKANFLELPNPLETGLRTYGWYATGRIYVLPSVLKDALSKAGYHWDRVKLALTEKGLLKPAQNADGTEYTCSRSLRGVGTRRVVEIFSNLFTQPEETAPQQSSAMPVEDTLLLTGNPADLLPNIVQ